MGLLASYGAISNVALSGSGTPELVLMIDDQLRVLRGPVETYSASLVSYSLLRIVAFWVGFVNHHSAKKIDKNSGSPRGRDS